MTGTVLVLGYVLIAPALDVVGSIVIVLSRGLFNTLIPVMVMQRVTGGYLLQPGELLDLARLRRRRRPAHRALAVPQHRAGLAVRRARRGRWAWASCFCLARR